MRIGDLVVISGDNRLTGVVTSIDDYDRATVKIYASGVEVLVDMNKLLCVGSTCPTKNVKVGSVVRAIRDRRIIGEVLDVDKGIATVKLSHSGLEVMISVKELRRLHWI